MSRSATVLLLVAAVLAVAARVWFWDSTRLTLEDAFITFRYADNISAGKGFVYNQGEHVLGTTTPLWTLVLAAARSAGATDPVASSRTAGIMCDIATLALLAFVFRKKGDFLFIATAMMVAVSPGIVTMSVSGMETPLLLLLMTAALAGHERRNDVTGIALGLTVLTRIDGVLFAFVLLAVASRRDHRWALRQLALSALVVLPWLVFSLLYFHTVIPQSVLAKASQYRLGFRASADPFIGSFTPVGEAHRLKWVLKLLFSGLLGLGLWVSVRRGGMFLALAVFFVSYCLLYMISGVLIFYWYLVPAVYASLFLQAVPLEWLLRRFVPPGRTSWVAAVVLIAVVAGNAAVLSGRVEKFRQVQAFEEDLRKRIGLWLRDHAEPGSSVLLEPIGYIGYYAGPGVRILDEVGLVTPGMVPTSKEGAGWYSGCVRSFNPDYIVQYTSAVRANAAMVTGRPLFATEEDRRWFARSYEEAASFDAAGTYPLVDDREKSFVVFRRSRP